jgi:acyl transferase domain-containing protein
MSRRDIAIIGMAGRFPGAGDVEELHELLLHGRERVGPISRERVNATTLDPQARYRAMGYLSDVDRFDHAFFDMTLGEARTLSPNARLLLQEAWHAFESSGRSPVRFRATRTDVYMTQVDSVYADLAEESSSTLFTGNSPDFIVARLNRQFDLRGNSVIVDTSCSSGVAAILMASDALRLGRADYALVCGTNLQLFPYERPSLLDTWSPDGHSRSYAADATGMAAGEVVACLLLADLDRAHAEGHVIHAVIRGGALNNNGAVASSPSAPHSVMQAEAIVEAWRQAEVEPHEIGFIEGHGSATLLGDSLEVEAFRLAFRAGARERPCALSSIKANIGHGKAAAGLSSVVKAVLSLQHGVRFPAPNVEQVNSVLAKPDSPVYVNTKCVPWSDERRVAAVHSVGMSGVNCHVVLENYRSAARRSPEGEWYPLPLCARTPAALYENAAIMREWISAAGRPSLADIAHTLCLGREHFERRSLILARNREELARALAEQLSTSHDPRWKAPTSAPRVVFLFSSSAETYSSLDAVVERLTSRFPRLRRRLEAVVLPTPAALGARLVAFQVALHELLAAMGLVGPAVGVGWGMSSAAVTAGSLSLADATSQTARVSDDPPADLEARAAALVATQLEQGSVVFLQVGTASAVSRALASCTPGTAARVEQLEHEDPVRSLGETLGRLFCSGLGLNLEPWFEERDTAPAIVPGYRFARTRCWLRETPKHGGREATTVAPGSTWDGRWSELPPSERRVAEIWRDLLGRDQFGRDDNLFDLGADSLLATRIVRRANHEFGVRCDFEDIFDYPTVAGFTRVVREAGGVRGVVRALWRDVLRNPDMGDDDNFFDLGGHSLLANEILHRVRREYGLTLNFEDFFANPSAAAFALALERRLQAAHGEADNAGRDGSSPRRPAAPLSPEAWAATLRRREMF